MDLQAILAASDDSDSSVGEIQEGHFIRNQSSLPINKNDKMKKNKRSNRKHHKDMQMDMDLERILREHDDSSTGSSIDMDAMLPTSFSKPSKIHVNKYTNYRVNKSETRNNDNHNKVKKTAIHNKGQQLHDYDVNFENPSTVGELESSYHTHNNTDHTINDDITRNLQKDSIQGSQGSLPLENINENFYNLSMQNVETSNLHSIASNYDISDDKKSQTSYEHKHYQHGSKDKTSELSGKLISQLANEEKLPHHHEAYSIRLTKESEKKHSIERLNKNTKLNLSTSDLDHKKNYLMNHTLNHQYHTEHQSNPEKLYGVHDPEDWAVLQAILSEADDSEEDISNLNSFQGITATSSSSSAINMDNASNYSNKIGLTRKKLFMDPNSSIMEQLLMEDDIDYDDDVAYDDYELEDSTTGVNTRHSIPSMSDIDTLSTMNGTGGDLIGDIMNGPSASTATSHHSPHISTDVDAILRSVGDLSSEDDTDKGLEYGVYSNNLNYRKEYYDDDIADFEDIVKNIQQVSLASLNAKRKQTNNVIEKYQDNDASDTGTKLSTSSKDQYNEKFDTQVSTEFKQKVKNNDEDQRISSTYRSSSVSYSSSPRRKNNYTAKNQNEEQASLKHKRANQKNIDPEEITALALKSAENYETRLLRPGQRDIISPLMVKRRMKPKIELPTRARILAQQKQHQHQQHHKQNISHPSQPQQQSSLRKNILSIQDTFNTLTSQNPKFDLSGVIQSAPLSKISSELYKNSQMRRHSVGLPTALAFNSKFIAIGTQRGIILVFDLFESLRQKLGKSNPNGNNPTPSNVEGSVTSIDLSADAETLIAGYTSGVITLWDVIRGIVLKSVYDIHPSPITSVRFLSDKDSSVVSVDAGGLVNKLLFSKSMIWASSYGVETECLLDGTAGQILAISVLQPLSTLMNTRSQHAIGSSKQGQHHPSARKLVLIALSSERSSFAVAVEPSVNVLHRWPRPSEDQITAQSHKGNVEGRDKLAADNDSNIDKNIPMTYLPCLSWGWGLVSGMGHLPTPILARGWGSYLQLLLASFPPNDPSSAQDEAMLWPAFGVHDEFDTSAPVVALEWLGERSLVYLTVTNEFTVIDTVMMTLLERLDFSTVRLVYAEFSLSRSSEKSSKNGNRSCTTFQNSFRSNDNRLLILCQEEAKSLCILDTRRRVSALEEDGEWLEALALALDHYESTVKSLEDKKREKKRNLSQHPEFSVKGEDEEWIATLLMRYLKLAVENAPESSNNQINSGLRNPSRIDLAQSHFQMLAGVCIEFCVVTRRLDLLFGSIFRRFQSARYTAVFLDVLEPYVLNDKLHYIAPEAMAQFVEHCKASNDVATVERCLLHMDVTILDFDSILSLLKKNGMYSALIHVFTHGLDDYVTPLEILMEGIFDAADECDIYSQRRNDGVPQSFFEQYGYKAILYIKYCLMGKTFPQKKEIEPEHRIDTLRQQILNFLLQMNYSPSSSVLRSNQRQDSSRIKQDEYLTGKRALSHPYLHILTLVDARAVLDVLSLALDAPGAKFVQSSSKIEVMGGWSVEVDMETAQSPEKDNKNSNVNNGIIVNKNNSKASPTKPIKDSTLCPDRQLLVSILASIILPMADVEPATTLTDNWQAKSAKNAFLDFMAKYLLAGVVTAPKSLTFAILSRMSERAKSSKVPSARRIEQEQIISLLEVLPAYSFDREEVLTVVESAGITRAALLLHKEAVIASLSNDKEFIKQHSQHFVKAIRCYLQDESNDFKREVFQYIKKQCVEISISITSVGYNKRDILYNSLGETIPSLIELDAVLFAQFIAEVYVEELEHIVTSLRDISGGKILFKFLHAIISGDLTKADPVAGSVLNANLSIDHHQTYLTIMAKFQPEMVYNHLSTHDNYRPDDCLKLCQEYEIADASAYLLERMGNVSSALQLMLQTLEGRMMTLKRIIRSINDTTMSNIDNSRRRRKGNENKKKIDMDANEKKSKEIDGVKQILIVALDLCERNSGPTAKTENGSQLWFNVLDRLINAKGFLRLVKELPEHAVIMSKVLSELLQLTMQRMVSKVPLPDLVHKITTDHSGNKLGEFREMIFSMLKTYSLELSVFSNAAEVMYQDVRLMSVERRNLKVSMSHVDNITILLDRFLFL